MKTYNQKKSGIRMANKDQFLTTGEFASKAGMATSSVTKLIRAGKIKAEKKSGKWMISPDQLKAMAQKDEPGKVKTAGGKLLSVAEFADMTYLTEFGVIEWLKQGRLRGQQVAGGEWKVEAANLETPDVKRLIRQG
jgi:predicted site-specific integrase-resolvase